MSLWFGTGFYFMLFLFFSVNAEALGTVFFYQTFQLDSSYARIIRNYNIVLTETIYYIYILYIYISKCN